MTPDLETIRSRLGIAISPASRVARSLAPEPGLLPSAPAPLSVSSPSVSPSSGLIPNPEATNFGRLAQARSDVPAMVAPGSAPRGVSPLATPSAGIDVNSYVGSRYAGNNDPRGITPGSAPAPAPSPTMLPTGNPTARDAILRTQFPNVDRRGLTALGNMAYNRPDTFNAAVAGTRLDPVAIGQQRRGAELDLARGAADPNLDPAYRSLRVPTAQAALTRAQQDIARNPYETERLRLGNEQLRLENEARSRPPADGQLVKLGNDEYGRPIQGIRQPNGQITQISQPPGMSFTMGPNGEFQFKQGVGELTTGATTTSQERQAGLERVVFEGASLLKNLRPEDVGVRGVIGENVINQGLAQVNPDIADRKLSENRAQLAAYREGALRVVSSDPRFSQSDRVAIEKILPESGFLESLPSVQAKLGAVQAIMAERAGREAARRGTKSIVAQTPEEIQAAAASGKLQKDAAAALLVALHPEWVNAQKRARGTSAPAAAPASAPAPAAPAAKSSPEPKRIRVKLTDLQ